VFHAGARAEHPRPRGQPALLLATRACGTWSRARWLRHSWSATRPI
jgi:hypothetical protein